MIVSRIVATAFLLVLIAGCGGDNDVEFSGPGHAPRAGTFRGTTSSGTEITIDVGSIERVGFTCRDTPVLQLFSPPAPIRDDGRFDVRFESAGRGFRVTGRFTNDDTGNGRIEDEQHQCDDTFVVTRDLEAAGG